MTATLDCIAEYGFANASTTEICKHAGVSRGALLHHFPTKELLIAASVDHLMKSETNRLRQMATAYAQDELDIDDFIDYMWNRYSGRHFMISFDYMASARTDDKLKAAIMPIVKDVHKTMNEIWSQFFHTLNTPPEKVQVMLNTTLCLLRGMAIHTVVRKEPEYFDIILENWKSIIHQVLDEGREQEKKRAG